MENLETRLNEVVRIAVRLEQQTACPAQPRSRSGHRIEVGRKAVGHANYFGIKRASRHAKWCTVATREVVNGKVRRREPRIRRL